MSYFFTFRSAQRFIKAQKLQAVPLKRTIWYSAVAFQLWTVQTT